MDVMSRVAISVIVPIYNVAQFIHRCINSIICQSFRFFELILVDDGGGNEESGICDEYAFIDSRVIVIHEKNGGLSYARNRGLDLVCTEFVSFIDGDDWWHKDYLSILYPPMVNDNVDMSICMIKLTETLMSDQEIVNADKIRIRGRDLLNNDNEYLRASACARIYRTQLFSDIRFPEGCYFEDLFIIPKIVFQAAHISLTNNELYYYYRGNQSSITKISNPRKRSDFYNARTRFLPRSDLLFTELPPTVL